MSEKTKALGLAALALVMLVVLGCTIRWYRQATAPVVDDGVIQRNMERMEHMGEPETTPPPEPLETEPVHILPSEDVTLLAKIMQEEDGHDWPDSMIMLIGEVVLNRVASPEYPDTIRDVLYEVDYDANGREYIQYAPVHYESWDRITLEDHYIELAERLLDGERVIGNPQIVYQATFEQGRGTVLSFHDFYIGSTTYFCLTDRPGLYG